LFKDVIDAKPADREYYIDEFKAWLEDDDGSFGGPLVLAPGARNGGPYPTGAAPQYLLKVEAEDNNSPQSDFPTLIKQSMEKTEQKRQPAFQTPDGHHQWRSFGNGGRNY